MNIFWVNEPSLNSGHLQPTCSCPHISIFSQLIQHQSFWKLFLWPYKIFYTYFSQVFCNSAYWLHLSTFWQFLQTYRIFSNWNNTTVEAWNIEVLVRALTCWCRRNERNRYAPNQSSTQCSISMDNSSPVLYLAFSFSTPNRAGQGTRCRTHTESGHFRRRPWDLVISYVAHPLRLEPALPFPLADCPTAEGSWLPQVASMHPVQCLFPLQFHFEYKCFDPQVFYQEFSVIMEQERWSRKDEPCSRNSPSIASLFRLTFHIFVPHMVRVCYSLTQIGTEKLLGLFNDHETAHIRK